MKFYQTKDAQLIKRWIQVTKFLFTLSEKAGGQRGDRALSDSQLSASSVMSNLLLVGAQLFPFLCPGSFNYTAPRFLLSKDSVGARLFLLSSSTLFLLPREGSRLFRTTLLRYRALLELIQSNTMRCRVT